MAHPEMFFGKIDVGLMDSVLIPALMSYADKICSDIEVPAEHRIDTAYLLVRLQCAMKQKLPGTYIKPVTPERLKWASELAKDIAERGPCPYRPHKSRRTDDPAARKTKEHWLNGGKLPAHA